MMMMNQDINPRSTSSANAASASVSSTIPRVSATSAIPVDTDISKAKMKTRLTYFAAPKTPIRNHSFGNQLDDNSNSRTSGASDFGLASGSLHSNYGSRRRSNFEEAVANLQQQQQQQQLLDHATYDEQIKLDKKCVMHSKIIDNLKDERLSAMPHSDQEEVPQVRNWLKDMGGDDVPRKMMSPPGVVPTQPPQPTSLEYDTSGRIVKSKINNLAGLGAGAPGAYSAGPGMEELLDTPDNYGRLGFIGRGSVRSSTKSKKEDGSKEFRKSRNNQDGSPDDGKGGRVLLEGTLEEDKPVWWKRKPIILAILLVAITAVVVPIVLVLQSNPSSESDTTDQQQEQQKDTEATIIEEWIPLVLNMTNATQMALEDPLSQQFQAYAWIAEDPNWDTYEDWRKQQRFAMMCFYSALGGTDLGFRFSPAYYTHECDWLLSFDSCAGNDRGEINRIGLIAYGDMTFHGTMPPELAFLSHLEEVHFIFESINYPHLEDMFPLDTINTLPPIKSLKFDDCRLGGSIPSILGLVTSLTSLELSSSRLASSIPSELGLLSNLTTLTLSSNGLTGVIPDEIGELPSLLKMDISNNPDLDSSIPSGFCSDDRQPFESLETDWCSNRAECCGS